MAVFCEKSSLLKRVIGEDIHIESMAMLMRSKWSTLCLA
jgi:hypothetical protein